MDGLSHGETVEESFADAGCDMLKELSRNGHLRFHDFEYLSIRNRPLKFVGGHSSREIGLDGKRKHEISTHGTLLWEHAVVAK